jgi:hypothetical protein
MTRLASGLRSGMPMLSARSRSTTGWAETGSSPSTASAEPEVLRGLLRRDARYLDAQVAADDLGDVTHGDALFGCRDQL